MKKRLLLSLVMLLCSAVLLSTASFAWFSMNTTVNVTGIELEAYSDAIFLEISTDSTGGFADSATVDAEEKLLRPVALGNGADGVLRVEFSAASGAYSDAVSGTDYYLRVQKSDTNDSRGEYSYVRINPKLHAPSSVAGYYNETDGQISFEVLKGGKYTGGTYYEKQRNSYVPVTLTDGDGLYGYYAVTTGTPCPAGSVYESGNAYYELRDGVYHPVGGLNPGSSLGGYYTVSAETRVLECDGSEYYLKNVNGDYISLGVIGTPEQKVALDKSYTYWYKGYSKMLGESQPGNITAVVDESKYTESDNPYYLYDTFYLRMAPGGSVGENLRISGFSVSGTDSLTGAIRAFLVATNGNGEVAYATCDANGNITHGSGEALFGEILGNAEEIIKVEAYIYYDGTSEDVKTHQDLVLSGHKIAISFSIDEPYYADFME